MKPLFLAIAIAILSINTCFALNYNEYCTQFTDGPTTETIIVRGARGTAFFDANPDAYFTRLVAPYKLIKWDGNNCKEVTPAGERKLLLKFERIINGSDIDNKNIRYEQKHWNKREDNIGDNFFQPRDYYIDKKTFTARPGEIFCGWKLSEFKPILDNAIWWIRTSELGAEIEIQIPNNGKLSGYALITFDFRFVKASSIPKGMQLQCEDTIWHLGKGEGFDRKTPIYEGYQEPRRCLTPDGVGYYCDRAVPTHEAPGLAPCGLACAGYRWRKDVEAQKNAKKRKR